MMRIFKIEGSKNSPWVLLNEKEGTIEISGISAFDRPIHFYRCVARWINAFNLGEYKTKVVNMRFERLDKASIKGMEFVLQQLDKLSQHNNKLIINWYYTKDDLFIWSIGKYYSEQSRIPFRFKAA